MSTPNGPGHQTDSTSPSDRPADPASATFPAAVTPKPGDTVRIRLDYEAEVDEDGDVRVPLAGRVGMYIHVARPDDLPDHWTVEIVTPPIEEPTRLGTVVVTAGGSKAVCVGSGCWQVVGAVGWLRWVNLAQPVRLATEDELEAPVVSGLLTDEEREAVRNMAYAGSYPQEKAARYVRTVEAIIDARVKAAKAEAWAEGYKQGGPMHDVNYDDPDAHTRNPYRIEEDR